MSDVVSTAPIGDVVDFGDTSFEPERSSFGDPIRFFRLSKSWPQKPFEDRRFQLGGIERFSILSEQPFVYHAHRFNKSYMGSGTNGYKRCQLKALPGGKTEGRCLACIEYENAPETLNPKSGRSEKQARCGRRTQQFAMNIVVYKTDLQGQLIDATNSPITLSPNGAVNAQGNPTELVFEVYLFRFSADKFQALRNIKKMWGSLTKHDLMAELEANKEENFQDFTPSILPQSAWQEAHKADVANGKPEEEQFGKKFIADYQEHSFDIQKILMKELSDEEMMAAIGTGNPAPTAPSPGDVSEITASIEQSLAAIPGGMAPPVPSPTPPATPPASPTPAPPPSAPGTPPQVPGAEAPATPPPPAPPEGDAPAVTADFDSLLSS